MQPPKPAPAVAQAERTRSTVILVIATVIYGLGFLPWFLMLIFAPMLYDSGFSATANLMVAGVLGWPIVVAVSLIVGWRMRNYKGAGISLLGPICFALVIVLLVQIVNPSFFNLRGAPPDGKALKTTDQQLAGLSLGTGEAVDGARQQSPVAWWLPSPGMTFQWQLQETPIEQSINAQVYDLDLFHTDRKVIESLHSKGGKVICYINVGAWEDWRPDKGDFPKEVIGKEYPDWAGEKYLDIRRIDLLSPILRARLDLCKEKGFDAVEPDNIDGYTADTGFPITEADQTKFNLWLAEEAHARRLSIGQKNVPEQVAALEPSFDWALTEDCYHDGWCDKMLPYIKARKAVFVVEYTDTGIKTKQFCGDAKAKQFSAILKHRDLDAWVDPCH